jgi:hypothetical protein
MNSGWTMVDYANDQLERGYYVKNVIEKNKSNQFSIEDIIYVFVIIYALFLLYVLL